MTLDCLIKCQRTRALIGESFELFWLAEVFRRGFVLKFGRNRAALPAQNRGGVALTLQLFEPHRLPHALLEGKSAGAVVTKKGHPKISCVSRTHERVGFPPV